MFWSGLLAAGLAFAIGGVSGEKWVGKENLVNALILGVSTELGLWANGAISPDAQILGDDRISSSLYTGAIYTLGYMLAARSGGMEHTGLFKDFGYGFGLSFVSYWFTVDNNGPGIGHNFRNTNKSGNLPTTGSTPP